MKRASTRQHAAHSTAEQSKVVYRNNSGGRPHHPPQAPTPAQHPTPRVGARPTTQALHPHTATTAHKQGTHVEHHQGPTTPAPTPTRRPPHTQQPRGAWTAKTVKRPRQQPAHPQYANYWALLTHKRHTMPHPAQPQHTNHWAPRTRKQHQQEHRPQRPTESSKQPDATCKGKNGWLSRAP